MIEDMNAAMREYLEINQKLRELEDRKDQLKSLMSVNLVEQEMDMYEDDDGNVASYKSVKRKTLDKTKVQNICVIKQIDYETLLTESEVQMFKVMSKEQRDNYTKKKVK